MSLRELVAEGFLYVVSKNAMRLTFRVHPVTFKGKGLSPEFQASGWTAIRDAAYEGHGA